MPNALFIDLSGQTGGGGGTGTVTSVDVSGGTTGLTATGGPITASGTITLGGTLALANGGTGATTDTGARANLGLGTIATQAANSVAITGGTVLGLNRLTVTAATAAITLNSAGQTFQVTGNQVNLRVGTSGNGTIDSTKTTTGSHLILIDSAGGTGDYGIQILRTQSAGYSPLMHLRKTISASGNVDTTDSVAIEVRLAGNTNNYLSKLRYLATNVGTHETAWGITAIRANVEKELFRVGAGTNGVFIGSDTTSTTTRVGIAYNGSSGYGLVLPSAQGSSGQTLQNDGSGNLSWVTPSGSTPKEVIAKVKTARETVTSSTTLQDDDHFVFAVSANKTYAIQAMLFGSSAQPSGGFKWAFTVPSGASGRASVIRDGTSFGTDVDITVGSGVSAPFSTTSIILLTGYITISSTAGNVTFQWAQNASLGTGTYLERGCTMKLTEV